MEKLLELLKKAEERARELGQLDELTEEQEAEFTRCLDEAKELKAKIKAKEDRQAQLSALSQEREELENRLAQPATEPLTRIHEVVIEDRKKPYKTFSDFLIDVVRASTGDVNSRLKEIRAASGLNEAAPSEGGFLVQQDFARQIFDDVRDIGMVLPLVDSLPVSGNGLKVPAPDISTYASGQVAGGIIAYWENEADAHTATKPKFREMDLKLHKVSALVYATDELLADAAALEAYISRNCPKAINWKVENAIFNGTGSGQPLGILTGGSVISVAKESGQSADTILAANVLKMYARMRAANLPRATWFISQDILPQLFAMTVGDFPIYLPAQSVAGAPFGTLLGRPVMPIEYCAKLGDKGDIVFADLSEYQMIDKGFIQAAMSLHVRFLYDEKVFKFVYRTDGQPKLDNAITPANGGATISPFITLAARA